MCEDRQLEVCESEGSYASWDPTAEPWRRLVVCRGQAGSRRIVCESVVVMYIVGEGSVGKGAWEWTDSVALVAPSENRAHPPATRVDYHATEHY